MSSVTARPLGRTAEGEGVALTSRASTPTATIEERHGAYVLATRGSTEPRGVGAVAAQLVPRSRADARARLRSTAPTNSQRAAELLSDATDRTAAARASAVRAQRRELRGAQRAAGWPSASREPSSSARPHVMRIRRASAGRQGELVPRSRQRSRCTNASTPERSRLRRPAHGAEAARQARERATKAESRAQV